MITTNTQKKILVEKLLQGKVITIDDAFLLLEKGVDEPITFGPYPSAIIQPLTWPSGTIICDGAIGFGGITSSITNMLPAGTVTTYC